MPLPSESTPSLCFCYRRQPPRTRTTEGLQGLQPHAELGFPGAPAAAAGRPSRRRPLRRPSTPAQVSHLLPPTSLSLLPPYSLPPLLPLSPAALVRPAGRRRRRTGPPFSTCPLLPPPTTLNGRIRLQALFFFFRNRITNCCLMYWSVHGYAKFFV